MNILVLNAGSSSVKYQLSRDGAEDVVTSGVVERIASSRSRIRSTTSGSRAVDVPSHRQALELIFSTLVDADSGVLESISEISAVGHRVLHSGLRYRQSTLITDEVLAALAENDDLAPLHNPYNTLGIREAMRLLPDVPHVAVFDTTFFLGMPKRASEYALPYAYSEGWGIRRFGIHGTSYRFVSREAAAYLEKPLDQLRIVICHLGGGSSLVAVEGGRAIDTTAGLTPLEGLVMGTRSGDLDPGVLFFLERRVGLGVDEVETLLNRESGLLGVSGVSNDMRDVSDRAAAGDERCRLAIDMYVYRIKKYIGAYAAAMGGLDALVFTGGIGQNAPDIRSRVCAGLDFLGMRLDASRNLSAGTRCCPIGAADAPTHVLVIPTNEERIIAEDTVEVIGRSASTEAGATVSR